MSRLLAIRPGGVGDCILSFPAIEHLRTRCTYLEVWVPGKVAPLVQFADRVRAISSTGLDLLGITEASEPVMESLSSFDAIVSWYGTNRDEFRGSVRDLPFEFHAALPPAGAVVHAADFFCSQVEAISGTVPRINAGNVPRRDFTAIHPFSGGPPKNWPLDYFDAVAKHFSVEWCATGEQRGLLGARSPLIVQENLFAVAQWLAGARVYVGNDSGVTHLAAAVGLPVVAIFTNASDPRVWAPRGEHVTVCNADAGVEAVAEAMRAQARPAP